MRRVLAVPALTLVFAAGLAGCGSSSPSTSAPPPTSPSSSVSSPSASATTRTGAQDLAVTNEIRAELVVAGAKAKGLTASDFTGLEKGLTYYAYDPATHAYWAGAALKPSRSSVAAQVASQDDGAYMIFHRSAGGSWTASDSALAGPNGPTGASPCTITPPADVLAIWGWPAHSCHPTGA